jgi:hypothetical protein
MLFFSASSHVSLTRDVRTHWQILQRLTSPSSSQTTNPLSTSLFFSNSTCSNPTPVTLRNPLQTSFGVTWSSVFVSALNRSLIWGVRRGRDEEAFPVLGGVDGTAEVDADAFVGPSDPAIGLKWRSINWCAVAPSAESISQRSRCLPSLSASYLLTLAHLLPNRPSSLPLSSPTRLLASSNSCVLVDLTPGG